MRKITLVCSLHRDNGLCNAGELLNILRTLDPDAIFGEVLQSNIDFYHPRSLEGQAVKKFLACKSVTCVRVDQYDIPPNFRALTDSVFDFVAEISSEYRALRSKGTTPLNLEAMHILIALTSRASSPGWKFLKRRRSFNREIRA